jgi:hypothetical protein
MKQVTTAILLYTQDYDEVLPYQQDNDVADYARSRRAVWLNSIFPYVRNRRVYICPSADDWGARGDSDSVYYYNGHASAKAVAAIPLPAESILYMEWAHRTASTGMRPNPNQKCPPPSQGVNNTCPDPWHKDSTWGNNHATGDANIRGSNYPFADGHVKFRTISQMMGIWVNY